MIRSYKHCRVVTRFINCQTKTLCRCMGTDNGNKDGNEVKISENSDSIESNKSGSKSISSKLAKPIGRRWPETSSKNRMPGSLPEQLDISEISNNIDERLRKIAKNVAKSFSDDSKDIKRTESELELMIKSTAVERESAKDEKIKPVKVDMMKILEGFTIEKQIPKSDMKVSNFVQKQPGRQSYDRKDIYVTGYDGSVSQSIINEIRQGPQKKQRSKRDFKNVDQDGRQQKSSFGDRRGQQSQAVTDIYGHEPFGIFEVPKSGKKDGGVDQQTSLCPTWETLIADELSFAATLPPRNSFEEQILWTKQGKLWHYPIDNEQGIESEKDVPFYEHVFLDHLLNEFPTKGPIRQFMEVMVLSLQCNPYISVERKKQTIHWFKLYFDQKSALARRVGAM